jgi:hypothetical protein
MQNDSLGRLSDTEDVAALAAVVTALALTPGVFDSVQPAGGNVLVSGSTTGRMCEWLTVDPATLKGTQSRGSCTRPRRSAQPAVPVVIPNARSQWQSVRIAHVGGSVTYGPVVMRYVDGSDTRPVSTYGPGSLWLYDVATTRGAELLRLSSRTGRLEQKVAMPRLFRPVIAADDDGLYLMAAANGDDGPGPAALYYVATGARGPTIIHREGTAALWITAHRHTVWTEIVTGTKHTALWRFDGASGRATRLFRRTIGAAEVATYGDGSLWSVTPVWSGPRSAWCTRMKVSRIDAVTGRKTVVTNVPASGYCSLLFDPQGLTFTNGAFYFLSGTKLYRVQP